MQKKNLIDYLMTNSGKLQENETWFDIGIMFGVKTPNKKRAKKDDEYRITSIAKKAQDIWRTYIKQQDKLKLDKQIYVDGKLKFETFKNKPDNTPINTEGFEIDKITTNPYGGAWFKLKKEEKLYDEIHTEKLVELLTKDLPPIILPKVPDTNRKALFIYGSDKHIGALTKENSIYTNKYDLCTIKNRIINETLVEIEKWVTEFGTFQSLFIMDLGDALDGFNQKTTGGLRGTSPHTLPQQLDNREQHDIYVEVHKALFDYIVKAGYAQDIHFIATSNSNHGGDFEYGAMRNLETYLNVRYPEVSTFVNFKPLNHFVCGEHCIIFGHGKDDEDLKNGLPLVLNDKVKGYISEYIRVNKLDAYHITFVSGDLHQSAETHGHNFRYRKVLSQYGSSKWMHTNFGPGASGLSSEVIVLDDNKIYKTDTFFKTEEVSNTGIKFQ